MRGGDVPTVWVRHDYETFHRTRFCTQGKTNFFERRVGEYQRAGVMQPNGSITERSASYVFTVDEDF